MNLDLSANELFEKYPELHNRLNWTKRTIGIFLRTKLLTGYYNRNLQTVYIMESSLLELMEFTIELRSANPKFLKH